MPSTFSPNLRLELIGDGEQVGSWGQTTNTNLGTLLEKSISGYTQIISSAAHQALTALNGADDESRNAIINLSNSSGANFTIYLPPSPKLYIIKNSSLYSAIIYNSTVLGNTTAAGTSVTIPAGKTSTIWTDGTNCKFQNDYVPTIAIGASLEVASGGTGASTPSGARTNLGLGSMAEQNANAVAITGGTIQGITDLAVVNGGTGASDAATARTNLDVPSRSGSGASGTWPISINGSSASTAAVAVSSTSVSDASIYPLCVQNASTTSQAPVVDIGFYFDSSTVNKRLTVDGVQIGGSLGKANTFIGYYQPASPSGDDNTSLGNYALHDLTTGSNNTAVGRYAGAISSGSYNTCLGYFSGSSVYTGNANTYIGYYATNSAMGRSNELVICTGISGTVGKGDSTGYINPNGGGVYQGNNSSSWSTVSDARIKQNFVDVDNGLEVITGLNPVQFDYILTGKHDVGFKAQEYMTVLPDQVKKHAANPQEKELVGEDEIYGIDRNLDPYFVSAIKELARRLEVAEAKLRELGAM